MPKFRVKPGVRHGAQNQYGPGDIVELTEFEAGPLMFKLERVDEDARTEPMQAAPINALVSATADGIVSLVLAGRLDGNAVIEAAAILNPPLPAGPSPSIADDPNAVIDDAAPLDFDVHAATIDEVLAAVRDNVIDAATALQAEQSGLNRTTLVAKLTRRIDDIKDDTKDGE